MAEDSPQSEKVKKPKPPKTDKEKRLEKILTVALAVAIVAFIYQIFHRIQVVKEAADPHSPNAELGRRQAMEADERMFAPREGVPLPPDSAVVHEKVSKSSPAPAGADAKALKNSHDGASRAR